MRYRTKVTLILLAVVGVTGALLLWLSHRNSKDLVFKLIQEKVLAVAVSTATQIDGDAHERLTREHSQASNDGEDDENPDYVTVRNPMRDSRDANRERDDLDRETILPVKFIYTIRPRTDGKIDPEEPFEYVVDAEEDGDSKSYIGDIVEFREGEAVIPEMGKAHVDSIIAEDKFGKWLTAFAPVRNSAGEDVALLGVDVDADAVIDQENNLFIGGLIALLFAVAVAALASIFLSRIVTAPLGSLSEQVALIGEGDLTTRIPFESNDEFGELGESIHRMADGLLEREAFKEALVRYVSSETSDSVIEETAKGGSPDDARRVTVLVSGLREFSSVSSSLPADKVFAFLSDWFSTMVDITRRYRGTIEHSAGETVTATFGAPLSDPDQERHALKAALTMQQELGDLRRRWELGDESGLSVKAAIHTGHVTLSDQYELQVMEFASLQRIIGVATRILEAAKSKETEGIVLSEATADGLKGSVPLTYLRSLEVGDTGEMLSLHAARMPTPSD